MRGTSAPPVAAMTLALALQNAPRRPLRGGYRRNSTPRHRGRVEPTPGAGEQTAVYGSAR
jgi:hypothetical protein